MQKVARRRKNMKYSIYVKDYLKRAELKSNPSITEEEAYKRAEEKFANMLQNSFYNLALAKLNNLDQLKQLELEQEFRFLDIHYGLEENINKINPYNYLYHGVRFDRSHKLFESILRDQKISCANRNNLYYKNCIDNCNEGNFVSLLDYSKEDDKVEFQTFIEKNVAFIISPKLNPLECKYLPYEEWKKIKKKLPKTKHRYSYLRHEYQYPDYIPLSYVIGILYPLKYFLQMDGYSKTMDDFAYIQELLIKYGFSNLPLLDPTAVFSCLNHISIGNKRIKENNKCI